MMGVLVGLAFWMYFLNRYARRFVRLRPPESGEHAAFPLPENQQAEYAKRRGWHTSKAGTHG